MNPCDHTSRYCECMTLAEVRADASNERPLLPIIAGCESCGRCRADCRSEGCGAASNCDVCRQPLDDPIRNIRCERCKEQA